MKLKFSIILLSLFSLSSFTQELTETSQLFEKIPVGSGPEDFVLDTITASPRLIIACANRRKTETSYNEILEYDIKSGKTRILPRVNFPSAIEFHPHGIDMGLLNGKPILLVVNHEERINRHSILRFNIENDVLVFDQIFWNPQYIFSPNDVLAGENGTFWFTNDSPSRKKTTIELLFGFKWGSIGYYNGQNWLLAAKGFSFPNGLLKMDNQMYVAVSRQNKIFKIPILSDGSLDKKKALIWAKSPSWDNLNRYDSSIFYGISHAKPIKYIKHLKIAKNESPVAVYELSTKYPKKKLVYYSNGDEISAGSSAIRYKDYLYISQVFESFILKIKM